MQVIYLQNIAKNFSLYCKNYNSVKKLKDVNLIEENKLSEVIESGIDFCFTIMSGDKLDQQEFIEVCEYNTEEKIRKLMNARSLLPEDIDKCVSEINSFHDGLNIFQIRLVKYIRDTDKDIKILSSSFI